MKYKNNKSGIIVVNKPKGVTSRDVVNDVQKFLNTKAGHTGTLDPLATGVLVVCLGKATKVSELLMCEQKEYVASVKLGFETDTLDIEGKVLNSKKIDLTYEALENMLKSYIKEYYQEVPMYSAVKVNGKKLYEYARGNLDVTVPSKLVTIYDLKLLEYNGSGFKFYARVSKGTYIRSLIRDICCDLDNLGTMVDLNRVSQGGYNIKDSWTLDDIRSGNYKIFPIKDALNLPVEYVSDDLKKKIVNGQKFDFDYNEVLFVDKDGRELAIYRKVDDELKVWKMLYKN